MSWTFSFMKCLSLTSIQSFMLCFSILTYCLLDTFQKISLREGKIWKPNGSEVVAAPCSQVQPVVSLSMLFPLHTQTHIHHIYIYTYMAATQIYTDTWSTHKNTNGTNSLNPASLSG